jgi:beta-lactamase class A
MHQDLNLGYENWSTPLATAEVIEALLTRTLFDKPVNTFIKQPEAGEAA